MAKRNLANKFFKEVKRLCDTERELTKGSWDAENRKYTHICPLDGRNYWPFGIEHEADLKDCFKRADGLWELNDKINTHCKDGGSVVVFIWRIKPNYNCYGQPSCTSDKIEDFLKNSETEKVLLEHDGFQFVWRWADVTKPTECVWGMKMGKTFFELRKDGKPYIQSYTKAQFIREYKQLFP